MALTRVNPRINSPKTGLRQPNWDGVNGFNVRRWPKRASTGVGRTDDGNGMLIVVELTQYVRRRDRLSRTLLNQTVSKGVCGGVGWGGERE